MANLFEAQTDELCYISVEDVRDTLWTPFLSTDTPLIPDGDIEILIVKAQEQVNSYLNEINPDIPCSGIVDPEGACNGLITDCADVPINIKRATINLVENIYTEETVDDTIDPTAQTMQVWEIVREKLACGREVEYYTGTKCCWEAERTGCWLVDCGTQTMLGCYEKTTWNFNLCKKFTCESRCNPCCDEC